MEFDVVAKTSGGDRKVSQQWSQLLAASYAKEGRCMAPRRPLPRPAETNVWPVHSVVSIVCPSKNQKHGMVANAPKT